MLEVLNAKTREVSRVGAENAQLVESAAEAEQAREETEKSRAENEEMGKEAMNKLSQLVRERDLEVEALKVRNDDLVALVQKADRLQGGPTGFYIFFYRASHVIVDWVGSTWSLSVPLSARLCLG